jgi:endonuclease III
MGKAEEFVALFKRAEARYGDDDKRLAAEGWDATWKVLIATILSAQSRDGTTIRIATGLFEKYDSLEKLGSASIKDLEKTLAGMNYFRTKARNVRESARMLISEFNGKVPEEIDELVKLPGVGRKTANLVITECFGKDGITVDTHVHRICNVFGFVNTKERDKTEMALREFVPREYWSRINRIFVLWGQDCPGKDKGKLLAKLD